MKPNKTYTYLANHGPTPKRDLPHNTVSTTVRADGVQRFNPTARSSGSSQKGGGQKTPVYYITDKHTPRDVIREWMDANQKTVNLIDSFALHMRISDYGDRFRAASKELLGPFPSQRGPNENPGVTDMECPYCGGSGFDQWPRHVSECPEL